MLLRMILQSQSAIMKVTVHNMAASDEQFWHCNSKLFWKCMYTEQSPLFNM